MTVFKEAAALQTYLAKQQGEGYQIGFVPTMGALHKGHISLVNKSKETAGITVCSIFVNPTQFNDQKDFEKYPVTVGNDIYLLEKAGCDVLFLPSVTEIYPNGTGSAIFYDIGEIENQLEGKYRPGHFQGVCQVVHKLLDIVKPDLLFIGQKDYQQCLVIKRLVELLSFDMDILINETLREPSGLAMSSRNQRLTVEELQKSSAIYNTLQHIKRITTSFR
jgi:pantoate--beta-alanine ligase